MNSAVNYTVPTEIHADDYALSPSSDADILALCKAGKLDGISILPNMETFDTAAKAFMAAKSTFPRDVRVAVHLNFMEGKCAANKEDIPSLVDNNGYFTVSWLKLLLWNYNPLCRKRIQVQLAKEIIAQTDRCVSCGIADAKALRFDSHQHPHAIPIVSDALMDAIKQRGYKVSYIRIPRDLVRLYLKQWRFHGTSFRYTAYRRHWATISPSNILKCLLLSHYSSRLMRMTRRLNLAPNVLCGVFYSGCMDFARVSAVLGAFKEYCRKKQCPLEVLFHPGRMKQEEMTAEFTKDGFNKFHTSGGRDIEKECVEMMNARG